MSFLVMLLVIWVEKFSALRQRIQQDGWWLRQLRGLEATQAGDAWQLLRLVLLPMLLLALLLWLLQSVAYGWLALPVHFLVLVYALGRGDVMASLGPFRDAWRRGDREAAYLAMQRDLGLVAEGESSLLGQVQAHLLWQAYQSFFAVIFWYALAGPVFALAYRLLALLEEHAASPTLRQQVCKMRHALDWLPVRLLAGAFALVGDFTAVGRVLLHDLLNWQAGAARLVAVSGQAAADLSDAGNASDGVATLDQLWQLLIRAAMFWYAAWAVWLLLI